MNKFSLFTQVSMVVVAVTIVLMYIQPKITSIRSIQDITMQYEAETLNVSQVNEDLKNKIAEIESVSIQDTQALAKFMPDTVDDISVLKDLSTILESQSISGYDIAFTGNSLGAQNEETVSEYNSATEYYFSATFEAQYDQIKALLGLLETNNYTLQVSNMNITSGTNDLLKVEMSLTVFGRASAPVALIE